MEDRRVAELEVDVLSETDSGGDHIGGPYGDGEEPEELRPPPQWMKWWTEEQRKLVGTVVEKMMSRPAQARTEPHRFRMTKMTGEDDPEAFLHAFERMAISAGWPRQQWTAILIPYLSGPAQIAVDTLPLAETKDYETVKNSILSTLNVSEATYRARLRESQYSEQQGARGLANTIRSNTMRWLKPEERSLEEVVELICLEQFVDALPQAARDWVLCNDPRVLEEAVRLMESYEAARRTSRPKIPEKKAGTERKGERPPPPQTPGRRRDEEEMESIHEAVRRRARGTERADPGPPPPLEDMRRRRFWVTPRLDPRDLSCFKCGEKGHLRRDCGRGRPPRETAWTGSQVHPLKALTRTVTVEGRKGEALVDSGCTQTLVKEGWVPHRRRGPGVRIRCVHGDVKEYPTGLVEMEIDGHRRRMRVGVAKELPYDVILGRDWPAFADLVRKEEECLESGDVIELGAEQEKDPSLRSAWQKAHDGSGKEGEGPKFQIKAGKLYRVGKDPRTQAEVDQLVLPSARRREALSLAHECPLAGHMREAATLSRLLARVYWPGIYKDVKEFCESCPACQMTQPRGRPGGELHPMPLINVPFERVAIDIVGPLPKGRGGYSYILVLVDYATRYPEAVPLRSTRASVVAGELLKIFSRVGFPKEVLTDQGSNFMSGVMQEMWEQLGVKHLHTSVFHPQANGLVERFNKTLKTMLRRFAVEEPSRWPALISPVLFAVREVPQASTGFSPFELLFGRQPRGVLDLARAQWEGRAQNLGEVGGVNVSELRERMKRMAEWARENLEAAQMKQKREYDQKVIRREFLPGEEVLLLLPTSDVKLLARWQGPYRVLRRVSPVDYELETPERRFSQRIYHVNLLKKWVPRGADVQIGEDLGPSALDIEVESGEINTGEALSLQQKKQVQLLRNRFQHVFSKKPGNTSLVRHQIKVEKGALVRQAPRKWPKHLEKDLVKEVKTMVELGVIEPSQSDWRSHPVMVPKPDGSIRTCIDFRQVNQVSQFDAYPMPRVQALIEKLGQARYISTLDLTKGYWQIPLEPESKKYTAFSTPLGLFQFRRMPFGLHGAAATFQRLVDRLLSSHGTYAAAYIDDIIIFSNEWEEHLNHVQKVLEELAKAGLTVNPEKCQIGVQRTKFLGFEVGGGQVRPILDRVQAIRDVPAPQNKKEVQRFLGMIGYYRTFIPNFSELAAPLTDCTRKRRSRNIGWDKECQQAFEGLKRKLCEAPILRAPDFSKTFRVLTDASARGVGAVLAQVHEGEEHPILYLSRKLTPAETKYSTIEREALAIKWALEALRYYLLGAPFELITDHAPLTWLGRMKDTNARLTRWYLSLQPYKFIVRYKKGTTHHNADFLSRQEGTGASDEEHAAAPILPGEVCGKESPPPVAEGMAGWVVPPKYPWDVVLASSAADREVWSDSWWELLRLYNARRTLMYPGRGRQRPANPEVSRLMGITPREERDQQRRDRWELYKG